MKWHWDVFFNVGSLQQRRESCACGLYASLLCAITLYSTFRMVVLKTKLVRSIRHLAYKIKGDYELT